MDDVRGDFLCPPHGSTSAAVMANKIKTEILSKNYMNFRFLKLIQKYENMRVLPLNVYLNKKKKDRLKFRITCILLL